MKVTFLGTGTSCGVPVIGCQCRVCQSNDAKDKRLRCSILVETSSTRLLIDCGPGSEGTVWRIGDVTARVACPDSAAGIFASASLCLSSGDQDPSCVRVYPGPCRIVRGLAGGIPFYSVESSSASGPERRALSLVFPGGTVMPVFDELKASHGSPGSLGDKVRLEWSCEYAGAPGNVFRHETTVSKDTFVLRELQD